MALTLQELRQRNARRRAMLPPTIAANVRPFALEPRERPAKVPATVMELPPTQRPWQGWTTPQTCPGRILPARTVVVDHLVRQTISRAEGKRLREQAWSIDRVRIDRERREKDGSDDERTWRDCGYWYPLTGAKDLRSREAGKLETTAAAVARVLDSAQMDYLVWMALTGQTPEQDKAYAVRRQEARLLADEARRDRENHDRIRARRLLRTVALGRGTWTRFGQPMRPAKRSKRVAPKGAATVRPNPYVSPVYVWVQDGSERQTMDAALQLADKIDAVAVVDVHGTTVR